MAPNTCGIVRARVGEVTAEACALTLFLRGIAHFPVVLLRDGNTREEVAVVVVAKDPPPLYEGNHARCAANAAAMAVGNSPPETLNTEKMATILVLCYNSKWRDGSVRRFLFLNALF